MNLFVLDLDPVKSARAYVASHQKIILEATQMLCTNVRLTNGKLRIPIHPFTGRKRKFWVLDGEELMYKENPENPSKGFFWIKSSNKIYGACHANHPWTVWGRKSKENFVWMQNFVEILNNEFVSRGYRSHGSASIAKSLIVPDLPETGLTPMPHCVDHGSKSDDVVESYRNYYRRSKKHLHVWKSVPIPDWINNEE
ncbi:hypothetical protein EVB32_250 [Rhizobium phage RHph_TM39]|nr:hypothetical protein EVB32_250 [Rhizobium phage RHph_TM39]